MFNNLFAPEVIDEALTILREDMPLALWETFYVTVLSTLFACEICNIFHARCLNWCKSKTAVCILDHACNIITDFHLSR